MKKIAWTLFCIPFFLFGCSGEQTVEVNNTVNNETDVGVREVINNSNEVYAGNAIFVDNQLLVAVQAKPWLDYKKKKIEKNLKKQIEEKFPDLEVFVSADYKLFWETQKLLEEEDEKKISDEVEKLKDLAKEET
ncbi:YhcN/YlaJ family sporulation lipoprotein [Lysinibacillus endophyticus]|uniref:YhcN/YlaJ family sporulation lipoprotein n=1 Tax=Ureibacillus endophyticus TaxID=1978490 RepID=UPI0014734C7F|nr:YhcN/YlaJ family sporulation lipoprotein [Lysinibacillus endophyticus]MCP1143828.1 YhcN/YlaJ family sporulation lipoprotein [Lysinibacillus endophyticus]